MSKKKKLTLDAYLALQGLKDQSSAVSELTTSEQFLLDWARKEGAITHFDMNRYYQAWCKRYYPDLHDERKLKSRFAYQANKLVKLGYLNRPNRIGLGPGARIELFGSATSQTHWELFVPKPESAPTKGLLKLVKVGGKLVWQ